MEVIRKETKMEVAHLKSKTTGRALDYQRSHPGALAPCKHRAEIHEAEGASAVPAGRHRSLRGSVPGDTDQDSRGPVGCRLTNVPIRW